MPAATPQRIRRGPTLVPLVLALLGALAVGCAPTATNAGADGADLAVAPDAVTLAPGAAAVVTATVAGSPATRPRWAADRGDVAGSGSSVFYTAPETPGRYELFAGTASASDRAPSVGITVDADIVPPISLRANSTGLRPRYRVGDEVVFTVEVREGGYLHLFAIDSDDRVLQIFPNRLDGASGDSVVVPGSALRIPPAGASYALEASEPTGTDTYVALWTREPVDPGAIASYGTGSLAGGTGDVSDVAAAIDALIAGRGADAAAIDVVEVTVLP